MAIDRKRVEEFEKKYKDAIFRKIGEVHSIQFEAISKMRSNATNLGQLHVKIPDASVTLNNKLVELSHEFRKAGISMFSREIEDDGFVGASFVGDAIINDLIEKLAKSIEKFGEYSKKMEDVFKQRNERLLALQNAGPIIKFFSRIRAFFVPVQPVDLSLTEEQGTLDKSLKEYTDIDSEIWNYNLEDNIVQALVKEIAGSQKIGDFDIKHRYDRYTVPGLLEECVIPDLKKLGLEHLIPQLQEALVEEYKKDFEMYRVKDEDMNLYVPDFSQKTTGKREATEEKLQGGLGLESFEAVDSSVSDLQRQDATQVISSELSKEQSKEKKRSDKPIENDDEIFL